MNPGRRGMQSFDKAKDFKKSMLNLINYCKPYIIPIIIAIILAMVSSILSIIGPDKLKEITNIISAGLMTGINMTKVRYSSNFHWVDFLAVWVLTNYG